MLVKYRWIPVFILACANLYAQQYGSIAGLVVDGENHPVAHAIVTLATTGAHLQDAIAWTDDSGRFAFGYLPPAQYHLSAHGKTGNPKFCGTAAHPRPTPLVHVAAGENRTDLVCRLEWRPSISGTVVDENGDPLSGVRLLALRSMYRRERRSLQQMGATATDREGHYRFYGLQPGNYVVFAQATMRGGAMEWRSEVSAKEAQQHRPMVRASQYYPGTEDAGQAAFIPVQTAKEASGIDIRLSAVPSAAVRGRVELPPELAENRVNVQVFVTKRDSFAGLTMGSGAGPPRYEFSLRGFAPGTYTLIADTEWRGRHYRAEQEIHASADDNGEVAVALQPGTSLSGTVRVTGPDAAKSMPAFVNLVSPQPIGIRGAPPRAKVGADGTFKFDDVPPGIWDINVSPIPRGGYIKSMMLGSQDVLREDMRITARTSAPLNIVVATKGATLKGDVTDESGKGASGVVVLAPRGSGSALLSAYRIASIDDEGHFEISGIPAGAYRAYAFDAYNLQADGPEGLEPFAARAVEVNLADEQTATQDLKLIAVPAGAKQ